MANVRLRWTLPTPTPNQRPIASILIEGRVDGAPGYTELNVLSPGDTEVILQNVAPGLWFFAGTVVDDFDQMSVRAEGSVAIPFDAPSALSNFTVDLV